MYFTTISLKNLLRRKMRTFFTLLGIGSAVGAFIALVGLSRGFENAWTHALLERDSHLFASPRGIVDILSATIDEKITAEMTKIEGVLDVSGELVDMIDLDTGDLVIVAGWPLDSYLWKSIELESGIPPSPDDPWGVILGQELSTTLGYGIGEKFFLRNEEFTVSAIAESGGVMRNHAIILSLDALQIINNKPGQITTINFRISDYKDRDGVQLLLERLEESFPDFVFTEALDIAKNNRILRLFRAMAWGTSTIALFIGLVVILNTLLMSVMERTRELGLLSSVGWSRKRIISLILMEGLLLSTLGTIFGIVIGFIGLYSITGSPNMQGVIQPNIDFRMIFEVSISTLGLGVLGSIYPAWRAVNLLPAQALRHE